MNTETLRRPGLTRFAALLKSAFIALLRGFSMGRGRKALPGIGTLALIAGLGIYLMGVYSALLASMLAQAGALYLLPMLTSLLGCMFAFIFTVPAAGGMLFGGKDNDLLLALPVSSFEILLSKVLALYLENLVLTLAMVLTSAVVYLFNGGPGGAACLLGAVFGSLFLAFLPTLLAFLFGYLSAWAGARLGKRSIFGTLLYVVFFGAVMVAVFQVQNWLTALMLNVDKVAAAMQGPLLPFGLMGRAFAGGMGAVGAVALLAPLLALPFLAVVWLFSRGYKGIVTKMASHHGRSDYKLGALKAGGPVGALLKKETQRFFLSPTYFVNSGFGLIMLVVAAVAALLKGDALLAVLAQTGISAGSPLLYMLACGVLLLLLSATNTASVSLSLEGKYLWILKSAPLPAQKILYLKAAFNVLICLPVAVAASLAFTLAFGFTPVQCLLLVLSSLVIMLFLSLAEVWINLCFPKLDFASEAAVVKQSLSAMLGMLGGMAVIAVGALVYGLLLSGFMAFELFLAVVALLLGLASLGLARLLAGEGVQKFQALS